MTHRIALVDDDLNITTSVALFLESEGFTVDTYQDGEQALQGLRSLRADLAVIDIKMPRMDGIELLGKLREVSTMPVIFLTSKDDELDEALGLRMGADDYITKPFSQRLLLERIRVVLRRSQGQALSEGQSVITIGHLIVQPERHSCTWKGIEVKLTVTEYLILSALVRRPGVVRNRDQLLDAAYGDDAYLDDRTIDSHIKRLRRKFRSVDDTFDAIETLYGIGYRYNED